jgi:hypothetical protein
MLVWERAPSVAQTPSRFGERRGEGLGAMIASVVVDGDFDKAEARRFDGSTSQIVQAISAASHLSKNTRPSTCNVFTLPASASLMATKVRRRCRTPCAKRRGARRPGSEGRGRRATLRLLGALDGRLPS